ncbi:MAG: thiol-disulfide oxidoreductase DCC family protein [Rhodobacterales bacterium]|nr:DUF393 domain-containing protein [Puniceibacterium antarcticum]
MIVIYNDSCPICAREVAGYKRMTCNQPDITYAGLSEADTERFGLSRAQAARRFHVLQDGQMYDGVAAFARVWDCIPHLRWLARLVRLPGIAQASSLVYDQILAPLLFAMHRRRERLGKAVSRG